MTLRSLFCSLAILLFQSGVLARPTIQQETVNGFKVYLIDVKKGNEVSVAVHVPVGSAHDEPVKMAGRAHLLEHVVHLGSRKYPGADNFNRQIKLMGADSNAWTSKSATFYYIQGYEQVLFPAIDLLGATFSEPEWSEQAFLKERDTVKSEALSYQLKDSGALSSMMSRQLAPRHLFAKFSLGTQAQLSRMRLQSLRELHEANYVPEYAKIFISGNLSRLYQEGVSKEQILRAVAASFTTNKETTTSPKAEVPGPLIQIPSFDETRSSKDPNYIEISSKDSEKILSLRFSSSEQIDPNSLKLLFRILRRPLKGNLGEKLKEQGLATEIYFSGSLVNNFTDCSISVALTKKGFVERANVIQSILETLEAVRKHAIPEEILNKEKLIILNDDAVSQESSEQAIKDLVNIIEESYDPLETYETKKQLDLITTKSMQDVASRLFDRSKLLVGVSASEVTGDTVDPIFKRSYSLNRVEYSQLRFPKLNPYRVISPPSKYPSAKEARTTHQDSTGANPEVFKDEESGVEWIRNHENLKPSGAIGVNLVFAISDAKNRMLSRILFESFKEKLNRTQNSLSEVATNFQQADFLNGVIQLAISGNSLSSLTALRDAVHELVSFRPTQHEINQAIAGLKYEYSSNLSDFPAVVASTEVAGFLRIKNGITQTEAAQLISELKVTPEDMAAISSKIFSSFDIQLAFVGDYSKNDVLDFVENLKGIRKSPLSASQRKKRTVSQRVAPSENPKTAWIPLSEKKGKMDIGWVRAFEGQKIVSPRYQAQILLTQILSDEVFKLNRTERGLGYVHGARSLRSGNKTYLILRGETNSRKKAPQIAEGWDQVIEKIKSAPPTKEEFEATKRNVLINMRIEKIEQAEVVEDYLTNFLIGNVLYEATAIRNLEKLTYEQFLDFIKEALSAKNSFDLVVTRSNPAQFGICKAGLTPLREIFRK